MTIFNKQREGGVWSRTVDEVLQALSVSAERGLDIPEVRRRRARYGPNRLREVKAKSAWLILADQFRSLIVLLLSAAAALSFAFQEWAEGAAIVAVIFINSAIGFFSEIKSDRVLREALEVAVLCNSTSLRGGGSDGDGAVGDPLEAALLVVGAQANLHQRDLIRTFPEVMASGELRWQGRQRTWC